MKLQINLLGPLQVILGEETAVFRTDAQRVLLAYLAAQQGRPQRRDTLAGLLSPDRTNKEALTYLRNRLARLRNTIGDDTAVPPWLDIDRKQIALRSGDDIIVDVIQFEEHLSAVETHNHRQLAGCPTCLARLETAVNLVRGELLAGLNFPSDTWEAWLTNQREHIHQRALEAMTWLRDAQMILGEWTAVLDIAQRQLSLEPWLESAHRAIMQAYHHLGDRNAALAQFTQCEQQLWDELGVEPETETITLFEQIKADEEPLAFSGQPSAIPHNLPLQTGRFFGRQAEQEQLLNRLVDPNYRLITLVGTGGIGKTRLSIEVGKQVQTSFPDGVWFVPLEAIKGGAEQIKIAVGEAIGLAQDDKQLTGEQVITILRDKQMLLIFDNSEVALDDIDFIPEWLRRAPNIAILATSREPLNFQAESVITLIGLPTGSKEMNAAEALFVERAQMARADFAVDDHELPQIRQICALVDGSPLGIGLAAAWVRRRSLTQIIESIGQSLDFLTTRLRDVDPRHRSMRAVLETSWQLLTPKEQEILAALAVFPASFTAVSAQQITHATLFDLDLLCEKSLLQQQHESERYVMHSLVRQFAAEKLGDGKTAVTQNFIAHFYQFADEHQTDYTALQPEWGNLLTAVTKAHTLEQWTDVLNLVQVLDEPWFRQIRFQEMRHGLALALDAATALEDRPTLARTLLHLGQIEMELNDYETAETHLAGAMELLMREEDSLGIAQAKYLYGRIKNEQTQDNEALSLFEESRNIFAEEEDWEGVARNLNLIALYHIRLHSDYQAARTDLEQSVSMLRQLPTSPVYLEALRYLARIQGYFGEYNRAESCLVEATEATHALQDVGEYLAILFEYVVLCKRQNQHERALQFGNECLSYIKTLGSLRWEALVKTQLAIIHLAQQDYLQAESFFQDSLQIFKELGDQYEQANAHFHLFTLYHEQGNTVLRNSSKQAVIELNSILKDPQLTTKLEQFPD